jgi:hypothetical protein
MLTQSGPINRYVVSNVSHRPVRTLLSVLAIAVEVTMILTLGGTELWDTRCDSAPYPRSRSGYHYPAAGLLDHRTQHCSDDRPLACRANEATTCNTCDGHGRAAIGRPGHHHGPGSFVF